MDSLSLSDLSTEILICMFKYLNIKDLCSLKQTCKRFNEVIKAFENSIVGYQETLVTNQKDPRFIIRQTSSERLSNYEKIRIENNWKRGRFKLKNTLLYSRIKYMSWLELNEECLWVCQGHKLYGFKKDECLRPCRPIYTITSNVSNTDIVKFKVKGNDVLIGKRNGGLCLWSKEQNEFQFDLELHYLDVTCVDISLKENIFISGFEDGCFAVWEKSSTGSSNLNKRSTRLLPDKIWAATLCDDVPRVAIGTSGHTYNPIYIHDIDSNSDAMQLGGAQSNGVLDLKWESPWCVWSCGYDGTLCRWDLRSNEPCVQRFKDPNGMVLYCLELDYHNTVMAGGQLHSRVSMWDTRQSKCVQVYFTSSRNSPVYGMSFDSKYLFTVIENSVNILDFSIYNGGHTDE
ncbi:F-box/WD repeat-containing protein 4 isoform X2 [Aethina tumida]|uniref:F-box/WD repeat-containing protein 4 isoform X2 n=1 Tax=Aethina tumida TaxID=116153 RepID=UPI002148D6A7|nr:F-box/WD repeat-containing protein 4 isoform X2 [Aethina tumida]